MCQIAVRWHQHLFEALGPLIYDWYLKRLLPEYNPVELRRSAWEIEKTFFEIFLYKKSKFLKNVFQQNITNYNRYYSFLMNFLKNFLKISARAKISVFLRTKK